MSSTVVGLSFFNPGEGRGWKSGLVNRFFGSDQTVNSAESLLGYEPDSRRFQAFIAQMEDAGYNPAPATKN